GSDYSASFTGKEGDKVFFASTRRQAKGKSRSDITGQKNADIFYSRKDDKDRWSKPKPMDSEINTENDEGAMSVTGNGLRMYFTRSRNIKEAVTGIYFAQRMEDQWGVPQKLKLTEDSLTTVAHPSVSADGDYLYFVSDMPGGAGGLDIWRAKLNGDEVMYIENMGEDINTGEDEMFPFIREDGTLYFASRGWPGLGGLDIFKATPDRKGGWTVENMGMPVNSTGDDFGITYYSLEEKGILSSDRGDTRGFDKLYFFELPELKCIFEGSVKGERKTPLNQAKIHIVGDSGYYEKQPVRANAGYQFKIKQGEKYAVQASCPGYLSVAEYFTAPKQEKDFSYRKDFELIPVAKTIRVDNIFFDFDQSTLRPESQGALDYLIMLLTENPHITIELSSHTDIIGSEAYNLDLSNRRAKSVVDYLIKAGISADRLTPKGYGKSVPVIVDDEIADRYPFLQYGD
ncbi:MAG: OmpA family protein, partial [Bacteroidales bacterium]